MPFKAELIEEPLVLAPNLDRVSRDRGALRAGGLVLDACDCCGEIKAIFVDDDRRVFAWIGIAPGAAREAAARLLAAADQADQVARQPGLGGHSRHRH